MGKDKVFYAGFQRVGTKSIGNFLELNGYAYATWDVSLNNKWPDKFSSGDYHGITTSRSFQFYEVFSDGPWFQPALVKFLYHEIPNSKFILLTRPPEDWFKSMMALNAGQSFGDLLRHCETYDRLEDYAWLREHVDFPHEMRLSLFDQPQHYMNVYRRANLELKLFFDRMPDSGSRVFIGELYDSEKYKKIAAFLKLKRPVYPMSVIHKTEITSADVLAAVSHGQAAAIAHTGVKRPRTARLGNLEELQSQYKKSPDSYATCLYLASSSFRWRKYEEAETLARKGIKLRHGVPRLHVLLSKILEKKGDYSGAVEEMRVAVQTIDDYAMYHLRLGEMLIKSGNRAEGVESLQRAVALDPGHPRYAKALDDAMSAGREQK